MSLRFQVLLAGTVIFLAVFFWLVVPPHTSTFEAQTANNLECLLCGLWALAVYVAFAAALLGHGILEGNRGRTRQGQED